MSSRAAPGSDAESLRDWLARVGYQDSATVEKLMEHIFLSEVLQECWFKRRQVVEVLRAEVDAAGYDLVLQAGESVRHVQLKASRRDAKTSRQTINRKLSTREGGCVVWITYDVDDDRGRVELRYRWWDSRTKQLPITVGRNPHTGKERPNTAVLKRSDFDPVDDTTTLVERLFGIPQHRD